MTGRPSGWDWPGLALNPTGSRLPSLIWPSIFLFYLVQPVIEVFRTPNSSSMRFAVVAVIAVYALSYLATLSIGWCAGHTFRVIACSWLFLMPIVLAIVTDVPETLVYWTYAIVAVLILLPRNVGVAFGLACAAILLATTAIEQGTPHWASGMILVVMTMAMFGFMALNQTVSELRATKDRVAELAVTEERARLARDLHDVLGHSLTTITLKAGLARRVLESSGDRDRAIEEISALEHLSRQALSEVRATVSGYREASLPAELVGAREALRAAEISADLPHAVDNVPVPLREPFAYVLREGVTNVIRHSGATRCQVRLGDFWIEIHDNGGGSTVERERPGHGLTGLAERLAPLGGTIAAGPNENGGFLLRATVPSGLT